MTRLGSGLLGLFLMNATTARASELPTYPATAHPSAQTVQYDGPMDGGPFGGGPGYGMPPDGPGYGGPGYGGPGYGGPGYDGPGYGGPGYGTGPGYGMPDRGRRAGSAGPHHYVSYHGFRIDVGGIAGVMDPTRSIQSVEHQIDIVDRVGLSPSMLALFRSFPIRVNASFANGSHYSGGSEVALGGIADNDRPVLLHEYMHVLHAKRLPQGFRNPTILRFYDQAVAKGLYEPGSYMMSNHREFFAVTASCFLNGTVSRAPYTREAIREQQPDYYAYLEHLFGRGVVAAAVP